MVLMTAGVIIVTGTVTEVVRRCSNDLSMVGYTTFSEGQDRMTKEGMATAVLERTGVMVIVAVIPFRSL